VGQQLGRFFYIHVADYFDVTGDLYDDYDWGALRGTCKQIDGTDKNRDLMIFSFRVRVKK